MAILGTPEYCTIPGLGRRNVRKYRLREHGFSVDGQRVSRGLYPFEPLQTCTAHAAIGELFIKSLTQALTINEQLLDTSSGLAFLHEKKVVHGDVHPVWD
jgi:hypothetical protein